MIFGKGVLVWVNGNWFEGMWENGVNKGNGIFFYFWSEKFVINLKKRVLMDSGGGGVGGERIFLRICIWDSDGEVGDIICDIIDNVEVVFMIYGDRFFGLDWIRLFWNSFCCFIKEVKKFG